MRTPLVAVSFEIEKAGFVGTEVPKPPGAFPMFTNVICCVGAGAPTLLAGKENEDLLGSINAKLAPVGVAVRGMVTFGLAGSLVKSPRNPWASAPATADAGTFTLTASVPFMPGGTLSDVGLTAKTDPVTFAATASAAVPLLVTVTNCGRGARLDGGAQYVIGN